MTARLPDIAIPARYRLTEAEAKAKAEEEMAGFSGSTVELVLGDWGRGMNGTKTTGHELIAIAVSIGVPQLVSQMVHAALFAHAMQRVATDYTVPGELVEPVDAMSRVLAAGCKGYAAWDAGHYDVLVDLQEKAKAMVEALPGDEMPRDIEDAAMALRRAVVRAEQVGL